MMNSPSLLLRFCFSAAIAAACSLSTSCGESESNVQICKDVAHKIENNHREINERREEVSAQAGKILFAIPANRPATDGERKKLVVLDKKYVAIDEQRMKYLRRTLGHECACKGERLWMLQQIMYRELVSIDDSIEIRTKAWKKLGIW